MSNLRWFLGPPAVLLFAMTACSRDAVVDEAVMSPNMALMPATATAVIDGVTYEYGCPTYPCPVSDIVRSQIANGNFMWLPEGTFPGPTIYLKVIQVPVQLRLPAIDPPPPPTPLKLAPVLDGSTDMMGERTEPLNQLACAKVWLEVESRDARSWNFVTGRRVLDFENNGEIEVRSASMQPLSVQLFATDWEHLVQGVYGVYPGHDTPAYDATFFITVRNEGDMEEHVLEHSFRCNDPTPPPPPAPWLTGPEMVRGFKGDLGYLQCSAYDLDLVSPDQGPWSYYEGSITLEYLRWGHDLLRWVKTGQVSTISLGPDLWDLLLGGEFTLKGKYKAVAYYANVNAVVERWVGKDLYRHDVAHTMTCVGSDFYDWLYIAR